jgi:hypothetical protein
MLLAAAMSFAASRSLPTPQADDAESFFAAIEDLIAKLERSLADDKLRAPAAQSVFKTPPSSPGSRTAQHAGRTGPGAGDSAGTGLSRLSISPIAAGFGTSASTERNGTEAVPAMTFASISGSGAFTSPKKASAKQPVAEPSELSASSTAAVVAHDAESVARIQLHNVDLQRRVERLQMSMKVTAVFVVVFLCCLCVLICTQSLESDFAAVIQEKDDAIRDLKRELAEFSARAQHLDRGGSDRSRLEVHYDVCSVECFCCFVAYCSRSSHVSVSLRCQQANGTVDTASVGAGPVHQGGLTTTILIPRGATAFL